MKLFAALVFLFITSSHLLGQQTYGEALLDSLSVTHKDFAPLIPILEKAIPIVEAEKDTVSFITLSNFLSYCYYQSRDYDNMEKMASSTYQFVQENPQITASFLQAARNNYSMALKKKGNHLQALKLQREVIETGKANGSDPMQIGTWHINLATSLGTFGDFEQAIEYTTKSLEYYSLTDPIENAKHPRVLPNKISKANYLIGDFYRNTGQPEIGEPYFQKSLESLLPIKTPTENEQKLLIDNHLRLADIYTKTNREHLVKPSIEAAQKIQNNYAYRIYLSHEILGKYYLKKNDLALAKFNLEKAIDLGSEYLKKTKEFPVRSRLIMNMGEYYELIDSNLIALEQYQKGMQLMDETLTQDISTNPAITEIGTYNRMLQLVHRKSKCAFKIYRQKRDVKFLDIAFHSYLASIDLLDKMRTSYLTDGSKFYVTEKAFPIYAECMEVLYQKYTLDSSPEILELIFSTIEKNKSAILFESLVNKLSLESSSLPKETIEKELSLHADISFFQKQISEDDRADEQSSLRLKNKLFELNEEYAIFDNKLKEQYPNYYQLKFGTAEIKNIQSVQNKLKPYELLLEFFQNEDELYVLSIDKNKIGFKQSTIDHLKTKISTFAGLISSKPTGNEPSNIYEISTQLYQQLVQPSLSLHDMKTSLIVIADGDLGKIPFEALCIADSSTDPINEYLLNNFDVSYYYSVGQYLAANESIGELEFFGFAPTFGSSNNSGCGSGLFSELPFAKNEVNDLSNYLKGKSLEGSDAKEAAFLAVIGDQTIIHLATHACLNQEDPMLSEIHFSDGYLTNYDIENLNVRPPLVVLSACNTGQGEIKRGEGIISLTRGFFEAGVQSLQSSLWSINDLTSSSIMKEMYVHLKNGETKSNALRLAKLNHLAQADKARSHPYYWAAMIQIGNHYPLYKSSKNKYWMLIGIGFFAFLLGTYFWYRNANKKA